MARHAWLLSLHNVLNIIGVDALVCDVPQHTTFDVHKVEPPLLVDIPFVNALSCSIMYSLNVLLLQRPIF